MRIGCGNSLFFIFRQIVDRLNGMLCRNSRNRISFSSDLGLSIPFPPYLFDFNICHGHPIDLNACWGEEENHYEYFTVGEIRLELFTPGTSGLENRRALNNPIYGNTNLLTYLLLCSPFLFRGSDWFAKLLCDLKICLFFYKLFIQKLPTSII